MLKECELSIITVNYNGLKDTCELMDTLPLDDTSLEVIVVDNASKEDEASIIAQRYPQVKVIRSETNLGFAGGNNLGIKASRGKYLFFINNDTLLYKEVESNGWKVKGDMFRPLINRLESSEKIGVVCPDTPHCLLLPYVTSPSVLVSRIRDNTIVPTPLPMPMVLP